MGGAQPLAATMNDGAFLGVEVDPARIQRRVETRYLRPHRRTTSTRRSRWCATPRAKAQALSVGLVGNAPTCCPSSCARGITPDLRHRPDVARTIRSNGYVPAGPDARARPPSCARATRRSTSQRAKRVDGACTCEAMLDAAATRARSRSTTATTCAAQAQRGAASSDAFAFPGFVPAYIRPLFCEGKGPFRWVALSGDPEDIRRTDELVLELFPHDAASRALDRLARERVAVPGPARAHLLARLRRAREASALAFNELVRSGEVKAPIVIGRDHLDSGSVASPNRETEAMKDGTDAVADWPILNALLNTASGAQLGVVPPRRRRRHRLLAARRPGHRRRRHAGGASASSAC